MCACVCVYVYASIYVCTCGWNSSCSTTIEKSIYSQWMNGMESFHWNDISSTTTTTAAAIATHLYNVLALTHSLSFLFSFSKCTYILFSINTYMHSRCESVAQYIWMMLVNTNECDTICERKKKRHCVVSVSKDSCVAFQSVLVRQIAHISHFSFHILAKLPYICTRANSIEHLLYWNSKKILNKCRLHKLKIFLAFISFFSIARVPNVIRLIRKKRSINLYHRVNEKKLTIRAE